MRPTALVVGGGWAGLSCAVSLVQQGYSVTLLEAAPQLGGRARSIRFGQLDVDNGQHLLLGAYHQTLALLRDMGHSESELFTRLPMQLQLNNGSNETVTLGLSRWLPAPFNLAWGLLRLQGCSWAERLQALGFALRMRVLRFRLAEDQGLYALLRSYQQSPALITKLWEPLCLATMNTPIHEASAQLFLNVLRDSFTRSARDTDILLPESDIGQLLPALAAHWLAQHDARVLPGHRVSQLLRDAQGHICGVASGETHFPATHVVLACAAGESEKLLQPHTETHALCSALQQLGSYPITTIYLRYAEAVALPFPLYGLLGTTSQWLVDRAHCQQADLLAVVISGPGPHMTMERAELARQVITELAQRLPHLATPLEHMVVREKRATFRAVAGVNNYRPSHQTALPGLWLAGDYTLGPYPATLEGAVQSGVQCARQILQHDREKEH